MGLRRNTPVLHYSNTPFCSRASHLDFLNSLESGFFNRLFTLLLIAG